MNIETRMTKLEQLLVRVRERAALPKVSLGVLDSTSNFEARTMPGLGKSLAKAPPAPVPVAPPSTSEVDAGFDIDIVESPLSPEVTASSPASQPAIEHAVDSGIIEPLVGSNPEAVDVPLDELEPEEIIELPTHDELLAQPGLEDSLDAPLQTPPPQSGPQLASLPTLEGPTAEQLGETVELEPAAGPPLELEEMHEPERPQPPSELEFVPAKSSDLPQTPAVTAGSDPLSQAIDIGVAKLAPPKARPSEAPSPSLAELAPERIERPRTAKLVEPKVVYASRSFHPQSFLELLDASLHLGSD